MENDIEAERHHYHYFDQFKGSFALISPLEVVSTAVVFVHGFGGDGCGTWSDFHLMIDDPDWSTQFSDADLFFFQYRSVWERIQSSTDRLLTFLYEVIFTTEPRHFAVTLDPLLVNRDLESSELRSNEVSALPADRHYDRIILVGHSEGGVVIRNAVDKKSHGNSPILKCHLRLFAPAIGGYAPAGILGILANSAFFGGIVDTLLRASPAYQDLSGSDLLKRLRRKTEQNAKKHKAEPAFRARILWGRNDNVVNPDKYDRDEEQFEERTHVKICKPDYSYSRPLELVSKKGQPI